MNYYTNTGITLMTRNNRWVKTFSSLDEYGNCPDNLAAENNVKYIISWRDLCGQIFVSYATVSDNEWNVILPAGYTDPENEKIYITAYWIDTDGNLIKFFHRDILIEDIPISVTIANHSVGFIYPNQAVSGEFMQQVHTLGGSEIKVKITQTGTLPHEGTDVWSTIKYSTSNSELTKIYLGAIEPPQGQSLTCEVYKDDEATGETIELPAGQEVPAEKSISINV